MKHFRLSRLKGGIVPIFRLSLFSFSYKNCIVFYGAIYAPDRFDHFHHASKPSLRIIPPEKVISLDSSSSK